MRVRIEYSHLLGVYPALMFDLATIVAKVLTFTVSRHTTGYKIVSQDFRQIQE